MYVQYNIYYHIMQGRRRGGWGVEKKLFNCFISNSAYLKYANPTLINLHNRYQTSFEVVTQLYLDPPFVILLEEIAH